MTARSTAFEPLEPATAALAGELHAQCFPDDAWSAETFAALLAETGIFGLLARDGDGEAAGLVLARVVADEAEILTLGVRPQRRRRGTCDGLVKAIKAHAGARGARRVFLEVGELNLPARQLYQCNGFHPVGRRPDYYRHPDGSEAALILRADL